MLLNPNLQKKLDRLVPKAEQSRFVEEAVEKALFEGEQSIVRLQKANPVGQSCLQGTIELFVDGGSRGNPGPAGGGFVGFKNGKEILSGSEFFGEKTNNQAEYLALRAALRETFSLCGDVDLLIHMDSQLMAEQLKGNYRVKNEGLKPLYNDVMRILEQFKSAKIHHIPREQNTIADRLANEAMNRAVSVPFAGR